MGFYKKYEALMDGENVLRKFKKKILGKRLNKAKNRKKIQDFEVLEDAKSLSLNEAAREHKNKLTANYLGYYDYTKLILMFKAGAEWAKKNNY